METQSIKAVIGALQTSETSRSLSLQDAKQDLQAGDSSLSVFRTLPPARNTEVMPYILRLAVNFPAMNTAYQSPSGGTITFWTVLAEQVIALGWSAERTRYAVEYMLRNCPYKEFRVAEFLNIDQKVSTLSNEDFAAIERSRAPHKPIVSMQADGKQVLMFQEDADSLGYKNYSRRYTTYEAERMTPQERLANGIRWLD